MLLMLEISPSLLSNMLYSPWRLIPPGPYVMPSDTPANIRRAVESSERTDEMKIRDYYRKPAEIMKLANLKEGDHIIEIASIGQYFTTMLVSAVGPKGRVDMFDLP